MSPIMREACVPILVQLIGIEHQIEDSGTFSKF